MLLLWAEAADSLAALISNACRGAMVLGMHVQD